MTIATTGFKTCSRSWRAFLRFQKRNLRPAPEMPLVWIRPTTRISSAVILGSFAVFAIPAYGSADTTGEWWMTTTEKSGNETRAHREQRRNALRSRLEPDYRNHSPLVSRETITALLTTRKRYRTIVAAGEWPRVRYDKTLRINDSGAQIRHLRARLRSTGDLRATPGSSRDRHFDATLQDAVGRFQARHGLSITGFVDRRTRQALNTSAEAHLRQLEVNLGRLLELEKHNKAQRYVLVNIPAFTLQAVEKGSLALESRVVVGRPDRQTPDLSASIRELNFYPYWRVPDSIATRDLIPELRKDPSYLYREHFSVLPAWGAKPLDPGRIDWSSPDIFKRKFRQEPGPFNALGVMRVNMPNKHIVYLHDTPLKKLFNSSSRAYSSGCVRVRKIQDLAAWLLKGKDDWSAARVQATVALGKSKDVKLNSPVPVHFTYVTAWATGNGLAHFRHDIYGRDGTSAVVAEVRNEGGRRAITP